jgi:uncharacterized cupredoxin-like copper-binding protein
MKTGVRSSGAWLVALATGALLVAAACQAAPTAGNAVVRVVETQGSLKPGVASAPAGKVTFVVVNQDKEDHEVVILKTDLAANALKMGPSNPETKVDETASGENLGEVEVEASVTGAGTFDLKPGHYALICNIATHYKQGMFADFVVK